MNCPYCGFLCDDGARFCPSCGKQMVAGESDFVSVNLNTPIKAVDTTIPHSEMVMREAEERSIKKFKALLVFALFLALALFAGAVYMVAFMPEEKAEEDTPASSMSDAVVSELVGSWVSGDSYLVLTASGRYACDGDSGSYASDDEAIVFSGSERLYAEYAVEDGTLTLVKTRLGEESVFTYDFVTSQTDLTYSQLMDMYESGNRL